MAVIDAGKAAPFEGVAARADVFRTALTLSRESGKDYTPDDLIILARFLAIGLWEDDDDDDSE